MLNNLKKLIRDEQAPTAVEYALMVAGIAVVIVAAVYLLGSGVKNSFSKTTEHLP